MVAKLLTNMHSLCESPQLLALYALHAADLQGVATLLVTPLEQNERQGSREETIPLAAIYSYRQHLYGSGASLCLAARKVPSYSPRCNIVLASKRMG
jgi:hypothetical protein